MPLLTFAKKQETQSKVETEDNVVLQIINDSHHKSSSGIHIS